MIKVNLILWVVSLAVECLLLTALVMRGIGRQVPVFTSLIAFYLARSVALRSLSGHVPTPPYMLTVSALAVVDQLLQIAVAWELFSAVFERGASEGGVRAAVRLGARYLVHCVAVFAGLVTAAVGSAVLLSANLHANPRAPMDRGVAFTSVLFVLIFAGSRWWRNRERDRGIGRVRERILEGFAFYGVAGIASQIGRTLAAADRNGRAFNQWSYAAPAAYALVMLFWILTLRKAAPETILAFAEPSPAS